jgi:hypothetical protein
MAAEVSEQGGTDPVHWYHTLSAAGRFRDLGGTAGMSALTRRADISACLPTSEKAGFGPTGLTSETQSGTTRSSFYLARRHIVHIGLIGGIGPAATEFYYRGLVARHAGAAKES